MLRYLCNACKREVSLDERTASVLVAREWGVRHKDLQVVLFTNGEDDIFCSEHLTFAEDYWTDKVLVCEKMTQMTISTLRNHCRDFFKRAVQGINESKEVFGNLEQVATRSKDEGSPAKQEAVS